MDNKHQGMNAALLVMDMQTTILARLAGSPELEKILHIQQTAIAAARTAGIPVIYVVLGFRKDFPEISSYNRAFAAYQQSGRAMAILSEPPVIHGAIAPLPDDIIVTKKRFSAFAGSDLEMILRAGGIRHLILTGVSTSAVVLSTLREAADKDFHLSVLSDGCADADAEVHTVLLSKVFPRQATVLTAMDWAAQIKA